MADIDRLLELVELFGRKMRRHLQPILEAEGLSFPELFVLRKVAQREGCRVTDLAEDIGIVPSTLTGITDRLVARGFLNRRQSPDDRRVVLLEAGPKLPPTLKRVQRARTDRLEGAFRVLPAGEFDRLVLDLEKLLASLEQEADE